MTDRNKETKRKRGRPRLIESPEETDDLVEKYLDHCQEEDYDATVDLLEQLSGVNLDVSVPVLRIDPLWDPLRDHPRFQRLLLTEQ